MNTLTENELRIGNYVSGGVNKDVAQITEIRENGVMLSEHEDCPPHYYDWISAIPLTEEWLIKFGYEKPEFTESTWYGKYHRIFEPIRGMYVCDTSGMTVKTVHQLQNIHHALTGEELKINE